MKKGKRKAQGRAVDARKESVAREANAKEREAARGADASFSADDDAARRAALREDAARSGDAGALDGMGAAGDDAADARSAANRRYKLEERREGESDAEGSRADGKGGENAEASDPGEGGDSDESHSTDAANRADKTSAADAMSAADATSGAAESGEPAEASDPAESGNPAESHSTDAANRADKTSAADAMSGADATSGTDEPGEPAEASEPAESRASAAPASSQSPNTDSSRSSLKESISNRFNSWRDRRNTSPRKSNATGSAPAASHDAQAPNDMAATRAPASSRATDAMGDSNADESHNADTPNDVESDADIATPAPSPRAARRAKRRAYLTRTPTLQPREARRQARLQRGAARTLGTPNRGDTGVPTKRHPVRNTFITLAALTAAALIIALFAFDVPNWQSLDLSKITAAPQTGMLLDNTGAPVTELRGAENRVVVPLSAIPEDIRNVFLAAEDLRFYSHHGVDVVRLFGALAANLREGGYAQGASTITMQLIRQSHLSTQKTIARKLEEIWLAFQLERKVSKDDILAMYLNYIYFGNGAYGIQAAAQTYFGVDVDELSLAQAAALAASIKAPSYYAPHVSAERNRSRRGYILDTMLEAGMISQSQRDAAVAESVAVIEQPAPELPFGWFVDAVLDEAQSLLGVTADEVLAGGYVITSTLSREHQTQLETEFTRDVFPAKASDGTPVQGAAACVNTRTGEVLAIVGGRTYDVRRGFNRATQLRRQPGSALKPLVAYAPAIESYGYMTASVLRDEPTNFNGYKPRNASYTYYGNVSMRSALQSSLNVATVDLLNRIGVQAGRDYLQSVGIPLDERDANLALALGAMTYGVSPVQLAAAYAPFGNGGVFHAPHFIRRIADADGRVLYQRRDEGERVLSAQSAYLMTSLLQSVTASGTGAKLSGAGTPVAGKTGTVNMTGGGNRDIWMAAYNSEISCAFWMGFDAPDSKHRLQGWVSGGDNTALLARNYFKALYQNRDKPQFTRPDGIVALEIDRQAIKWRGEPMLAVDLTPKAYRYTEYFAANNRPTKQSDVWTPPRTPNRFTIGHSESGAPLLMIQPADTAVYRVQRDTYGESFVLTELYGTAGETLYYADTTAQPGVVYTYRVIPVHAELLNNGILLEGVQAVQVAQARASNTLVERLAGFFGVKSPEESSQPTTENVSSIFWGW